MPDTIEELQDTKCGVYLIVSPTNGRYVGSSKRLDKRFNRYKNYSCKNQPAIYSSLVKYGYENHRFSVLKHCEVAELYFWERVFGDIYLASANFKNGLNLALPSYEDTPSMLSDSAKLNISIASKKRFESIEERERVGEKSRLAYSNPELRKKVSEIHKKRCSTQEFSDKMSNIQKEHFKSSEARKKLSDTVKQYYKDNPEKYESQRAGIKKYYEDNPTIRSERMIKRFLDNPNAGKEHSVKLINYYNDNPHLRVLAAERTKKQLAKYGHPMSKKIINTDTNEIFDTFLSAAKHAGFTGTTFRRIIKGQHTIKLPYKYL